jgi:Tfp pilus assembly protein PilF
MFEQELKRRVSEAIGKRDFLLAERLCHQAEGSVADAELFLIRGVVYSAQGDLKNARSALARAHQALPERGDIAYNYGVVLQQSGRMAEAVETWKKATASAPQNAAAWVNLALATLQLGDAPTALATYRRGLKYHPTHRDLLYNYANLLFRQGQLEKGDSLYQKLLKFHRNDAQAWINYGNLLKAARRYAESESCYRQAIAAANLADRPQAHFNLANLLLQQGRWQEGFAAYQWRLQLPSSIATPWRLPEWKTTLPGGSRILLWNDQGQGDAIMFLRFATLLAQRGYRLFAFV